MPFLWFGKTTEYWGLQGGCSVWPQGAVRGPCRWCYLTLGAPAWLFLARVCSAPRYFPLGTLSTSFGSRPNLPGSKQSKGVVLLCSVLHLVEGFQSLGKEGLRPGGVLRCVQWPKGCAAGFISFCLAQGWLSQHRGPPLHRTPLSFGSNGEEQRHGHWHGIISHSRW